MAYQKVEVVDLSKIKPNGRITNILVIGMENEEDFIDEIYFKVGDASLLFECEKNAKVGYMRSVISLRFLNDMSLYLTVIGDEEKIIVFIEREYFEKMGEVEINSMLQKRDLADELRRVKLDHLKEYYLSEPVYFELTNQSREERGHQYLTLSYLPEEERLRDEFKTLSYKVHYEPLVFHLNRKQLLFLGKEDLETQTIRLLETDSKGKLLELARFQFDGCADSFCENLHSPTDVVTFNDIILEIKKICCQDKDN